MSFTEILEWIKGSEIMLMIIRAAAVAVIGLPLLHVISFIVKKAAKKRFSPQSGMLLGKAVTYTGSAVIILMIMNQLGFRITALLGAAGIAGIAIGFAAQTSVSNIISGLFLISEKPFEVGDLIRVGDTLGIVFSIDLLSIKLRKLDNLFVRIPNETIIKAEVTNITRFPIRRLDIDIGVAYKEDPEHVHKVLAEIAVENPYCLDEPAPLIVFKNFGDSALEFMLGVWFYKTDYLALKNSVMKEIKNRFDRENIEIPFPHRTVYTGSATDPFPVRVIGDDLPGQSEST